MKGGKEKSLTGSSFPLFVTTPTHPGLNLLTCLTLMALMLALPHPGWGDSFLFWIGAFSFSLISCPSPLKPMFRLAGVLPLLCLALLLNAFFTPGTILLRVGPLFLTKEGLTEGAWITQKLAFLFYLSFLISTTVSSLFLFQLIARLKRFPFAGKLNLRLWILSLFLILKWLRLFPATWKAEITATFEKGDSGLKKTLKGLRALPEILRKEIDHLEEWNRLLVLRGYAEGILILSESPFPPLRARDIPLLLAILIGWGIWLFRVAHGLETPLIP